MNPEAILPPFFGVMLLTLAVWLVMYARRIAFLRHGAVDLATIDTPEKAAAVIPGNVSLPAHNLRNLFELPVVFYAVCLYLYASSTVDTAFVAAAWWFLAFRVLHSVIHCSYNRVMHRFVAYQLAAIALWVMVVRAALQVFVGT